MSESSFNRARSRARRLAAQAVYQCLVGADAPAAVVRQFVTDRNTGRADLDYFREVVGTACDDRPALEAVIDPLLDRPLVQLDPVEHAILLIAVAELRAAFVHQAKAEGRIVPVLVEPVFNKFTPMPAGALRSRIEEISAARISISRPL
jgi:transcription termination factor NusB